MNNESFGLVVEITLSGKKPGFLTGSTTSVEVGEKDEVGDAGTNSSSSSFEHETKMAHIRVKTPSIIADVFITFFLRLDMWDLNKKALTLAKPVTDFDCEVMKIIR